MSIEEKLQTIFKEHFQIKRVSKQIDSLREAKQKLGLQTKFSLTRGIHISVFVQILPSKLKELKKLSTLRKLDFKIVLKSTYPTEAPRLYFLIDNAIELGLNPFHDYLDSVIAEWNPKVTLVDIVKFVPSFLVKCLQRKDPILGNPLLYEFFQIDRLFMYHNVQTFPVKFVRLGQLYQGMLVVMNHLEVILLEQTNFQGGYAITDFISIFQIQSVQKHKTKPICAMFEVKRRGNKFGVQFFSDQFDNIISSLSEAMKENILIDNSKDESEESQPDESEESSFQKKAQNTDLVITDLNISEVESQMTILQSLVQSDANSKNIKQLVELLKKTVQYFSMKSNPKCHIYLKQLQDIMGNEFMQALLESQAPTNSQQSKKQYESIADLV